MNDNKEKVSSLGKRNPWIYMFVLSAFSVVVAGMYQYIYNETGIELSHKVLFYVQTVVTLLVVCMLPCMLWYVRKERFVDTISYNNAVLKRNIAFCLLTVLCALLHVVSNNVSFLYLGIITLIGFLFARGEKTDFDSDRA